ncbi:MAG TPA: M48 family metalloprotease [Blastocatellia bacterium]|nr:M48 family metalloprotease [Blastocatellia bacterium]
MRTLVARATTLVLISMLALQLGASAQTQVKAPKNPYSPDKDVQLGRQAAAEVERQLPLINDREIEEYIAGVGRRLVSAIPREFQNPAFHYSLKVVDARDINAFALPGGFSYVNRGLIEAAQNEGELAGVIAHEFSHVALRHGTAQVAKAQKYSVLGALGQVAGAVIGGAAGGAVSQGSQLGVGAYFLRFSREYEKEADILGSHIMANAGYDPRDLANMFRTIERQSGGGGPQWLSSHPNPGNRFEYITREAEMLNVSDPIRVTADFTHVRALLRDLPRARSMQEIGQGRQRNPAGNQPRAQNRVDYPSARYRSYDGGGFQISVPDNWQQLNNSNELTFAPAGGYDDIQGRSVFTHGVMVGMTRATARNLRQATDQYLNSLSQGNPSLRPQTGYESGSISGQQALAVTCSNVSEASGAPEIVMIYTSLLRNGELFYMIGVAPQEQYRTYQPVFQRVLSSIRFY